MFNKTVVFFLVLTAGVLKGMDHQENNSQSSQATSYDEETVRTLIRLADPYLITQQLLDTNWPITDNSRKLLEVMSVIGLYLELQIPFDVYTAYPLAIGTNIPQSVAILINRSPEWVRSYALACLARYVNLEEPQNSAGIDSHTLNRIHAIRLLLHRSANVCINMDHPAVITVLQDPVALGALFILPTITLPLLPITRQAHTSEEQTAEEQQNAQEQRRIAEAWMRAEGQKMVQEQRIRELEIGNLDRTNRLLLFAAIREGAVSALTILLEHIDHTSLFQNITNNTPIHFAVICNRPDILRILLQQNKRTIDAINANGHTALHIAVMHDNLEAVRVLLEHGAFAYARTPTGQTALDLAQEPYNNMSIIRLLMDYMVQEMQYPVFQPQTQTRTRLSPVIRCIPAPLSSLSLNGVSDS
jgi:hypothetical protein